MSYHVGDLASITTGRLLGPDGMDGVYRILNHLTGKQLFTHQLPRAREQCLEWLYEQIPELHALDDPEALNQLVTLVRTAPSITQGWDQWFRVHRWTGLRMYYRQDCVKPLPEDRRDPCNPLEEAIELLENDPADGYYGVMVVAVGESRGE